MLTPHPDLHSHGSPQLSVGRPRERLDGRSSKRNTQTRTHARAHKLLQRVFQISLKIYLHPGRDALDGFVRGPSCEHDLGVVRDVLGLAGICGITLTPVVPASTT